MKCGSVDAAVNPRATLLEKAGLGWLGEVNIEATQLCISPSVSGCKL